MQKQNVFNLPYLAAKCKSELPRAAFSILGSKGLKSATSSSLPEGNEHCIA